MRPTVDIWLEIVHRQLAVGDSATVAVNKAHFVTNACIARFANLPEPTAAEDRIPPEYFTPKELKEARAWAEQLANKVVPKDETLPIPTPGYIAGDPNAR